ncbi:MAG TPA: Uma2 family endonuclease [Gemmatimonadota bacterium]|nr:Uma2 family endonuclease [Gemmatimonadota bacterium]
MPGTELTEGLLTLEEFERLPEENEYLLELVRGRLVREPRPGAEHGLLAGELVGRLYHHVRHHGLGRVVTETGFLLAEDPPTVRGPDVAFISAGRFPRTDVPQGFWRVAPDLAVEIVSPSNSATEIQEKVLEYLEVGAALVWVVDPRIRTVTVFRSKTDVRVLTEEGVLEGGDVLPGFQLAIAELFEP